MKKILQLLGCATLAFMCSCSDSDEPDMESQEWLFRPFYFVSATPDNVGYSFQELCDFDANEAAYLNCFVPRTEGTYILKPRPDALICTTKTFTPVPSKPTYTLIKVITMDGSIPDGGERTVVNGQVDEADIKIIPVGNNYEITLPALNDDYNLPIFRVEFSCNFGENSPFNDVKALVYVNRIQPWMDDWRP